MLPFPLLSVSPSPLRTTPLIFFLLSQKIVIGFLAVTQLFRLTTLPSSPAPISSSYQPANLAEIHQTLFEHSRQLALLSPTSSVGGMVAEVALEGQKYRYLGKPVGGVFLILALVFLLLGTFSPFPYFPE